jgi:hypothetical protein
MLTVLATMVQAQIVIGGSVYGGARQANVGGSTSVEIGADNYDVLIGAVYGGNDISGTIGTSADIPKAIEKEVDNGITDEEGKNKNAFNAFVRISPEGKRTETEPYKIFIGKLFGGGNGAYEYEEGKVKPELGKTYLELKGGTVAQVFGGGNNATVTSNTSICIDNQSKVVNDIKDAAGNNLLTSDFLDKMGINSAQTNLAGGCHYARVFGGNNLAEMKIRPFWFLKRGKIRDLYSGGNQGNMTSPEGLLLEIDAANPNAKPEDDDVMMVINAYGGCRMADVRPQRDGKDVANSEIQLDPNPNKIPAGFGARIRVLGGWVNNVYGGNDITGNVYGGNTVGIFTTIHGNVYGGGNGSYAYTDKSALKGDKLWGDYYYDPGSNSVEALNNHRPNAEQVSIRVVGTENKPTVIEGSLYVGGNSATIKPLTQISDRKVELKMGSYVYADQIFLGNNGENMVDVSDDGVLKKYAGRVNNANGVEKEFSSLNLTNSGTFESYMDGCAMTVKPSVIFDTTPRDPEDYTPYSSYVGSFYCGGNVGSMKFNGLIDINFSHKIVIFDKLVGGCNTAFVPSHEGLNAEYKGGVLGDYEEGTKNKLQLNLSGLLIEPKRWKRNEDDTYYINAIGNRELEWNTWIGNEKNLLPPDATTGSAGANDLARRFKGGNIYGGCCESGVVNGNVIININSNIMERDKLFDEVETSGEESLYGSDLLTQESYTITKRNSGVLLGQQGMDVLGQSLNLFGGGKGAATQIWGSTTINMNKGYVFQVFGGSEEGVIGKPSPDGTYSFTYILNGEPHTDKYSYSDDYDYSCYVNLKGAVAGFSKADGNDEKMPESEFIYGGSFKGPIAGNAVVRLGNGRIFNAFTGSCDADILGHTETYVGYTHTYTDDNGVVVTVDGYPWIRDIVYGGNDLGGEIKGTKTFSGTEYVRSETDGMRYSDALLTASSYMEYRQGHADAIFGGHFGTYDYSLSEYERTGTKTKPYLGRAFVNFRPTSTNELKAESKKNVVNYVYGGSQGQPGDFDSNKMQESSYVLIDIPQDMNNYKNMIVFGAGAWGGLGMKTKVEPVRKDATPDETLDNHSAIIDLVRGKLAVAYGGSYQEGVTRRTVVNVPATPSGASRDTLAIGSIFGGAFGTGTYSPCDVYEANVNYNSSTAALTYDPKTNERYTGSIYGGNNNERRTLYGHVNISSELRQKKVIQYDGEIGKLKEGDELMTYGTVYGAGRGGNTWSEYTEVNLNSGAKVYEVYGGGQNGKVYNAESVQNFITKFKPATWPAGTSKAGQPYKDADWAFAWKLGPYDLPANSGKEYWENTYTNLANPLVKVAEMDDRDFSGLTDADKELVQNRYSANVIIKEGAYVSNYAYGGGYGVEAVVSGTTYITLLGGEVNKDIYAAGTSGSVEDLHAAGVYSSTNRAGFVASTNAYIKGGTVRNVYGGGWRGSVGHHGPIGVHTGDISEAGVDIDGESHVVIGDVDGSSHTNGIPSVTRNVYGGGEGGTVFGDAYVTINKGYIGYRYNPQGTDAVATTDVNEMYEPELDDVDPGDNLLDKGGNVFGGGYVANSYVDRSHVTMYGGIVRGSLYGGGEIGPIGRGTVKTDAPAPDGTFINANAKIYKGGSTCVEMYDGHVMRDVFGGGRGYDNWGGEGWMTDEEKKTMDKSSKGYVFGSTDVHILGGEIGTEGNVLKGYGNVFGGGNEGFVYSATGTKGVDTYYYRSSDKKLSEDCKIAVEPQCKVIDAGGITIDGTTYAKGDYVPLEALNKLKSRDFVAAEWKKLDTRGIVIHNALFAGGNITEVSDKLFANTVTVYGNAAASLRDVYNFDLISLGTEEMGGLYGDGNLTLVDGFRELHIDNYGTDYYSLRETMLLDEYKALTPRQQAYYKLKYGANLDHTYEYYESKLLHTYTYNDEGVTKSVSYRKGEKIPRNSSTDNTYNNFSDSEKENWTQGSKVYKKDEQIEEGEYSLMDGIDSDVPTQKTGEKANWTLLGVTSIYAGRPMNTIQRADFCGVFGSRMVMKGAVDRAPQVNGGVDYNSYTINRVEEVSLNKRQSQAGDASNTKDYEHGNYFGIYNSVKFLGNLTSDVRFADARKTDTQNTSIQAHGESYYDWKSTHPQSMYRNNGISHNKVALASGVYLELKKEETESAGEDKWGYITGIIELDLINVMPGMGGGYVYAKNEHGSRTELESVNKVSLLSYNTNARTYRQYTYSEVTSVLEPIETSGNFVHNTKQIVDDCYPNSGIYNDQYVASPAHYWFIRGSIYVYEQYISAYTGSANATAEKQEIPLTIAAASNGRMTLRDVQPNYYAYYDKGGNKLGEENADSVFVVNNVSYKLNQAISNWDYNLLSEGDKAKFVDKTYVVVEDCKIGTVEYKKGSVMLVTEYNALKDSHPTITYMEGDEEKTNGNFDYFFRLSNNLGHDTGYVLTYDVNNPMVWNNYYTLTASPGQPNALNTQQYVVDGKDKDGNTITRSNYTEGPTYTLKSGVSAAVFGQQDYNKGSIIYGSAVTNYEAMKTSHPNEMPSGQAKVEQAWVLKTDYTLKNASGEVVQEFIAGTPVYKSKYEHYKQNDGAVEQDLWTGKLATVTEQAKVCTSLLEFTTTDYVWAGQVLTSADIAELKTKVIEKFNYDGSGGTTAQQKAEAYLASYLDDAYYCTEDGKYGGIYFTPGQAYRAIDTWCSMTATERENFTYNYDALDLLIDPTFGGAYGSKAQYDGDNAVKVYSSTQPIDYQAEFVGYKESDNVTEITYRDKAGTSHTISKSTSQDDWLTREAYESIPNEKRHYSPITITEPGDYYIVRETFMNGEVPYTTGQQIDEETYTNLGTIRQGNIDVIHFEEEQTKKTGDVYEPKTYYYCRNSYTVNEKGEGMAVTTEAVTKNNAFVSSSTYKLADPEDETSTDDEVPQGVVISETTYDALCNFQMGFVIHGTSPTEISTLYVSNESDINDLSAEKIITVIYLYEYDESDESGLNVTPVSERHIVNIHINFKSGVPEIGDINKPDIVLPGTTIGLNIPSVTQGAYRVTESGWEIFSNADDAATHYNGTPFVNNETPLYWYQNNYWIAYYAQTILGKTYSKSVPLSVANYHDLKKVMEDKHHYYIDHQDVERAPKIYINDYTTDDPTTSQNGLDLLKQLFDLTYATGEVGGHQPLNSRVQGGNNLEFFLRTDIDHGPTTTPDLEHEGQTITTEHPWTPIANNEGECFSGILHGDGHTINGLDHSLINHLCGQVYNLGVTGSFTGAGVAETGLGYVENCWVKTSAPNAADAPEGISPLQTGDYHYAVFGHPKRTGNDLVQVVNCYYSSSNGYTVPSDGAAQHGIPTPMAESEFYNGTVAYNLNGFYLNKRYYKGNNTEEPTTSTKPELTSGSKYVEDRFADGDFIYANGSIPEGVDERAETNEEGTPVTDANGKLIYHPKWPDDYFFFGQTLDYGYGDNPRHQDVPSSITALNRVYRAPAYFRGNEMRAAHFNANAVFAHNKKDDVTTLAHKDMTAIDFTGYNDAFNPADGTLKSYQQGSVAGQFYAPLLDDGGLTNFRNEGLTRNLLVYTGTTEPASAATNAVIEAKLTDKAYAETHNTYRTVAEVTDTTSISGHWVQWQGGSSYKAFRDHFLVDKNDFYCPIAYTFTDGPGNTNEHRMWYQRKPDLYVDRSKGWEDVSLPFTADIVTTHQKGEITHFYGNSSTGHEYWLREFNGNIKAKEGEPGVITADFNRPAATGSSADDKTVTNTYLWDYYYYERTDPRHLDLNTDEYQTYYNSERTYSQYSRLQAATPYLIGFPGITYYEFDLSGNWTTSTTAYPQPNQLEQQIITFASKPGEKILASDQAAGVTEGNYTYVPNFLNCGFKAGTANTFVLNGKGSSYDVVPAESATPVEPVKVYAFRPYFTKSASTREETRSIVFSEEQMETKEVKEHGDPTEGELNGGLKVWTKKDKIYVQSSLSFTEDLRIVTPAGITVATFTVKPGQTVEVQADFSGIYVVHTLDGKYIKKVAVKRE